MAAIPAGPTNPERKRKSLFEDAPAASAGSKKLPDSTKSDVNPWTGKPYSQRYYGILEKRQGLPVAEHREAFLELVARHQVSGYSWVIISALGFCCCCCFVRSPQVFRNDHSARIWRDTWLTDHFHSPIFVRL